MANNTRFDWIGRGIKDDLKRRIPHYISDWKDVFSWKILSATLFMFVSSFGPAITFSVLISKSTKETIGVIEVLLATSITGVLMSILAGQPIIIVGVTGPVAILTASIYTLSEQFGIEFLPFYAWSQLWAAFMIMVLAILNACDTLKFITNFSCETFGVLIALIYVYTGIDGIVLIFSDDVSYAAKLLQLIIVLGVAYMSFLFHNAKHWIIFTTKFRGFLADYGPSLCVVLWSIVPFLAASDLNHEHIPTLDVPAKFSTTTGRDWLVPLTRLPVWAVFAAIFPGIIITVLFYFDHNVSSVMAQTREMKLKKGSAFHWDFFVLGLGVIVTGLLGLPPTNGLIPQAPLHAKSLIKHKKKYTENDEVIFEHEKIFEQRLTNFLQSLFCGIAAVQPFSVALRQIPTAVLYGLFIFLGIISFDGNQFYHRLLLFFMTKAQTRRLPKYFFSGIHEVSFQTIKIFTIIQAILCSIIFIITFTPAEVIFPILIALLVCIRLWIFPKYFKEEDLNKLDAFVISSSSFTNKSEKGDDDEGEEEEELPQIEFTQNFVTLDRALPSTEDIDDLEEYCIK